MILAAQLMRHLAGALSAEARKYVEGTDEYETFQDAADALNDAADLAEDLNA